MYTIPEEEIHANECGDSSLEENDSFSEKKNSNHPDIVRNLSDSILRANETMDDAVKTEIKATGNIQNRQSVSLIDITQQHIDADSATFDVDKKRPSFVSKATTKINVLTNSSSYLQVQDYHSNSNLTHMYEEIEKKETFKVLDSLRFTQNEAPFLCESLIEGSELIHDSNEKNLEQISDDHIFVSLNKEEFAERNSCQNIKIESYQNLSQRSGSMQWIQNAFQSVGQRFLDLRRPSDIVTDHMRKSNEEIEMDQNDYCVLSELQHEVPRSTGRRYSENVIGKQKKLLFSTGFVNLKGFWKDRQAANKHQQEEDFDRIRPDVCPLFNFPKKGDEDEIILDALRQAMRKCTIDNPDSRPTSDSVLVQLSQLLD